MFKIPAGSGSLGRKGGVKHPTQKPLLLCDKLIKPVLQYDSKDLVVVPFAGSGSECVISKKLGVPFLGFDLNPEYVKLANNRVENTLTTL